MTNETQNDGRFPDDSPVWVWYPPQAETNCPPRDKWAWLPGSILSQCGPDEWHIVVEVRKVATLIDGSPAPRGTPDRKLYHPTCYRDASELRPRMGKANELPH
jgi:hypothetical protein